MILTGEYLCIANLFLHKGKAPVATNIVEAIDLTVLVLAKEEGKSGGREGDVVTVVAESILVRDQQPVSREYGSTF